MAWGRLQRRLRQSRPFGRQAAPQVCFQTSEPSCHLLPLQAFSRAPVQRRLSLALESGPVLRSYASSAVIFMSVFPGCAGSVSIPTLSRASIPERGQKCDHFHAFSGAILRYLGENAILSDKGGTELKKQKRFLCHAILSEKPVALTAPRIVAIYLGNSDYFMINDTRRDFRPY